MNNIALLGLGNFGTALARNWIKHGLMVKAWTVEEEVYISVKNLGVNEKYLPGISVKGLSVSMSIEETVIGAEVIVLALPSSVVVDVFDDLIPFLAHNHIILDLAKGLGPDDGLISETMKRKLLDKKLETRLCVMMGPTIATELARGAYTSALVTSADFSVAKEIAESLSTAALKLAPATDSLGAEYWGAFKNVIALACGVVDGLKKEGRGGDNLKAAVFALGYREAFNLLPSLGAQEETALSAAGIGDLFVTATSPYGRNREMGERLGSGQSLEQATEEMVMVSEGVNAARMFNRLFRSKKVSAPFVESVCRFLESEIDADELIEELLE
mgnify:FL=1